MTAFERYFHGDHGAARAVLLEKSFLALLALDTWMLMIGHAGRYGAGGFNVAHFGWLDALLPVPSPAFYIGVLTLTGLLALAILFAGHAPVALAALVILYTFSWSMSMLDSYQHHYFVSLALVCLTFFPRVSATDVHPVAPALPSGGKLKPKKQRERERVRALEASGWMYLGAIAGAVGIAAAIGPGQRPWLAFLIFAGAVAIATSLRPTVRAAGPALAPGFGLPLLCATVGITYTFTAIAKMDAGWLAGHTMRAISKAETAYAGLAEFAVQLGVEREAFWAALSTSVIPLELAIACGYFLAAVQDRPELRRFRWFSLATWALAMSLHVGAEAMELDIGWFSYYMMLLAAALLLPLDAVDRLATVWTWPARALSAGLADFAGENEKLRGPVTLALATAVAVVFGMVGHMLDLPGTLTACGLAALAMFATVVVRVVRGDATTARRWILASGGAAACMWLAITIGPARFEYYRFLGGDLRRRGEPAAALEAYLKAERYAREGESRADKIEELRQQLGK